MYTGFHVKFLLFLLDFKETWFFSTDFQQILKYKISQKSIQYAPTSSMWTDKGRDRRT